MNDNKAAVIVSVCVCGMIAIGIIASAVVDAIKAAC